MTCYIKKRKYDSIGQTRLEPFLATAILHIKLLLFRWFASTIQNVLMALSLAINLVRLW
jgi:hypothetical protein